MTYVKLIKVQTYDFFNCLLIIPEMGQFLSKFI